MDELRPKLHHRGRFWIYFRGSLCLMPHSLELKNIFFWGCVASSIMDSKSISKTFLYGEIGLNSSAGAWDIGQHPFHRIYFLEAVRPQTSLEAVWPQAEWTLKVYPKPSHMVKFWFQLVSWGLRYRTASVYQFKTCFSHYSEAIAFFDVLISHVGKVFTIEMLC